MPATVPECAEELSFFNPEAESLALILGDLYFIYCIVLLFYPGRPEITMDICSPAFDTFSHRFLNRLLFILGTILASKIQPNLVQNREQLGQN